MGKGREREEGKEWEKVELGFIPFKKP